MSMNRKGFAVAFVLAFFSSVIVETHLVNNAVCHGTLNISVNSPQNKTYTTNNISVSISASDPQMHIGPESVAYIVDGGPQVIIATVHVGMHSLTGNTVLSLPSGPHSLVGIAITWFNGTDGVFYSSPVYFTVSSDFSCTPTQHLHPLRIQPLQNLPQR
jgi:predicted secreted protein